MPLDNLVDENVEDEELNTIKIQILDYYISRHGAKYQFFYDTSTKMVYASDKVTPLFEGLNGVIGNYNIQKGYKERNI